MHGHVAKRTVRVVSEVATSVANKSEQDGGTANIATDVATVIVRPGPGRSDVHRARAAGPLRLLCPRGAGNAAWIVTSSLGGGLVDGDAVALDVTVDAGATCVVTTQASTKVYKGTTRQETRVRVHGDGAAIVVPDAIVPYRDASYVQRTSLELGSTSTLVFCDVITAGRVAYGERWSATRIDTLLELEVDGEKRLRDRVLLADDVPARMRRFAALGTAVLLGPRVADLASAALASLPPLQRAASLVIAGSPLGASPGFARARSTPEGSALVDGAIFRIAGDDIEGVVRATRDLLRPACARLGEDPWSRRW
jgi:urease accessory protein